MMKTVIPTITVLKTMMKMMMTTGGDDKIK
jgi:hypothetical protein